MLSLDFIPKLTESLFYLKKDNKHLFLNTDLPNWQVVNQNCAFIIGKIDGKKSIQNILDELKSNNILIKSNKILELFESLKQYGIVNDDVLIKQKNSLCCSVNHTNKFHLVHFKLTDECNLSCKYCYAESGASKKKTLDIEELKKVVDEVKCISTNVDYTLSGGEPFLYPNLFELMEYIHSLDNKIFLLTNGMYITEENSKKVAKLCSLIKISIDGSNEEINSITRGKNSFQSALNGFKILMSDKANVQVTMTVTQKNIGDIKNMLKLFGNRLTLQPFFKAGRGTESDEFGITGEEYYNAMASIEGFQPMARLGESLNIFRNKGTTKCAMADSEISISDNGDVYPCQMLAEDDFYGGNIKENSIKEILNSKKFQEVASFSSLTNEECKECPIKLLCGGACRARSYFESGSIFVNSDFCEYEKMAFINGIFEHAELKIL